MFKIFPDPKHGKLSGTSPDLRGVTQTNMAAKKATKKIVKKVAKKTAKKK